MLLFEDYKKIESICKQYNIINPSINPNGLIDVRSNVNLTGRNLSLLPLRFNIIYGLFNCSNNQLTSLEGAPKKVISGFNCNNNKLTSLEGGPKYVGKDFFCAHNNLSTLEGGPKYVGRDFSCVDNKLTSLEGIADSLSETSEEVSSVYCDNNPIYEIFKLFKNYYEYKRLLDDYNYFRGTRIIRARFEQACIEVGIKMPEKIEGYTII